MRLDRAGDYSLTEADYQTIPPIRASILSFLLEKIGRMRPHILIPELEELMALSGKALDTSYRAFGALNNADLTFKPQSIQGQERPLSNGSYSPISEVRIAICGKALLRIFITPSKPMRIRFAN